MNSSIGVVESRQQQRRKLRDMINRDDLFDVWVRMVLANAPAIYVFVNITLLIWIAQTIFSSKLSGVPNSLYFIAPLITTGPLTNLTVVLPNSSCPSGTTPFILKTLPYILQPSIPHSELTFWGDPGVQFCGARLTGPRKKNCSNREVLCSGYCVKDRKQCPITNIKALPANTPPQPGFQLFFTMWPKSYYYSREDSSPIVSILATYSSRCANDEHYNEVFDKQSKYWQVAVKCREEGTINSFFTQFDKMETNVFLKNNNISLTVTEKKVSKVSLGFVNQFILSTSLRDGCKNSRMNSQQIIPFLRKGPVAPQSTQALLIISFILLVAEIFWLIAFYCFSGYSKEKNIFVGLMSIIELVIISFIYSQNLQLFYVEKLAQTLGRCLKQSMQAMSQWHFGIQSPQVFKMVIFINTVFLGMFITVYLLNSYCFKQLHRRPFASAGHGSVQLVN